MSLNIANNNDGSVTVLFPDLPNIEEIQGNNKNTNVDNNPIPIVNHDWIPVENPPKKNGWYLVYAEKYGAFGPNKNHNGVMFSRWNGKMWTANRYNCITHWMPLPNKPYTYLEEK